MVSDSAIDEGLAGGRRMAQPLAIAVFSLFACVFAVIGGVTIFGRASDGSPIALIDLGPRPHKNVRHAVPPPAQTAMATPPATPAPPPVSVPPDIVPAKIVKAIYAGRALVADPALIEQTDDGPLPRIADDGRTPMAAYAPSGAGRNAPAHRHRHQRTRHQRQGHRKPPSRAFRPA